MTDISAAIGKRIRTFRNAQGISLEELSFKADLNAAHLGQIERGLRNPTIETLNRIATALDISFYELIGSVEEVPQKQPETNEIKRKIDAQLSSMTLDEQKDILRIIRIFRRRFDEENNIEWSRRLEYAGCNVIYGLPGYKVHSKLCLVTRKHHDEIQYLTQVGTGNYNEKTAELYTDLMVMTANPQIGENARQVFQALVMGEVVEQSEKLLVAPKCLQNRVLEMIDEEIAHARQNEKAYIGLKMNSLTDKKIIDKLIEASQAGVKIDMVVRGICCLAAGIPGYTENIEIRSIVGRYLEHSRIYIFGIEERRKIYIASADFMTRNTVKRVEVAIPIESEELKIRIEEMFITMLSDNKKARKMKPNGLYEKLPIDGTEVNAQELLFEQSYLQPHLQ